MQSPNVDGNTDVCVCVRTQGVAGLNASCWHTSFTDASGLAAHIDGQDYKTPFSGAAQTSEQGGRGQQRAPFILCKNEELREKSWSLQLQSLRAVCFQQGFGQRCL